MSPCSPSQSRILSARYYYLKDKSAYSCSSKSILGSTSFKRRISEYSSTSSLSSISQSIYSTKDRPKTSSNCRNASPNFVLSGTKLSNRSFRPQSSPIVPKTENKTEEFENRSVSPVVKPYFNVDSPCLGVKSIPLNENPPKSGSIKEEQVKPPESAVTRSPRPVSAKLEKKTEPDLIKILSILVGKENPTGSLQDYLGELEYSKNERKKYSECTEYLDYFDLYDKILSERHKTRRHLPDFPANVAFGRVSKTLVETLRRIQSDNMSWRRLRCDLTRLDNNFSGFISISKFISALNRKQIHLTNEEEYALLSYFDCDLSGTISYNHFLRMVM